MNNSWLLTNYDFISRCAFLSFAFTALFAGMCKLTHCNLNIWHIPRNIIRFFIYLKRGRRYIANIDGTWRMVKGSESEGGYLHIKNIFPGNKRYCLGSEEFRRVAVIESDEDVTDTIIALNLQTLKALHPLPKRRLSHRSQDPFVEQTPLPQYFEEALHDFSPEMRMLVERQLYPGGIIPEENEI